MKFKGFKFDHQFGNSFLCIGRCINPFVYDLVDTTKYCLELMNMTVTVCYMYVYGIFMRLFVNKSI